MIVCLLIADCGDECVCRIAALQASRAGEPEEIRAVVQFDIIPADNEVELVVCHRVLDNYEVLAACKVTGDLLGDFVLERGIRS